MHAILSRKDLKDVVAWMPHGRSFKILDAIEFEIQVIPVYFEHGKIASFNRQANNWGFKSKFFHAFLLRRSNRFGVHFTK